MRVFVKKHKIITVLIVIAIIFAIISGVFLYNRHAAARTVDYEFYVHFYDYDDIYKLKWTHLYFVVSQDKLYYYEFLPWGWAPPFEWMEFFDYEININNGNSLPKSFEVEKKVIKLSEETYAELEQLLGQWLKNGGDYITFSEGPIITVSGYGQIGSTVPSLFPYSNAELFGELWRIVGYPERADKFKTNPLWHAAPLLSGLGYNPADFKGCESKKSEGNNGETYQYIAEYSDETNIIITCKQDATTLKIETETGKVLWEAD